MILGLGLAAHCRLRISLSLSLSLVVVVCSPSGDFIVSGSECGGVYVWRTKNEHAKSRLFNFNRTKNSSYEVFHREFLAHSPITTRLALLHCSGGGLVTLAGLPLLSRIFACGCTPLRVLLTDFRVVRLTIPVPPLFAMQPHTEVTTCDSWWQFLPQCRRLPSPGLGL